MRFNPNCVRDILFECEKTIQPHEDLYIEETDIPNSLSGYSWAELLYHLEQCNMSGLFVKSYKDPTGAYCITDLSPKGHNLLSKIRNDKIWKKILKNGVETITKLIELSLTAASVFQNLLPN